MASALLSLDNEVFSKFAFYAGLVLLKTILMSLWTARHRIPKQVFISPEDYKVTGKSATTTTDADVERVRRCHQNDIEKAIPFVLIGLLYVLCDPSVATATLHFQLFAGFRILHTLVYLNAVRQPARAICFFVNIGVNISMLVTILQKASYLERI